MTGQRCSNDRDFTISCHNTNQMHHNLVSVLLSPEKGFIHSRQWLNGLTCPLPAGTFSLCRLFIFLDFSVWSNVEQILQVTLTWVRTWRCFKLSCTMGTHDSMDVTSSRWCKGETHVLNHIIGASWQCSLSRGHHLGHSNEKCPQVQSKFFVKVTSDAMVYLVHSNWEIVENEWMRPNVLCVSAFVERVTSRGLGGTCAKVLGEPVSVVVGSSRCVFHGTGFSSAERNAICCFTSEFRESPWT